MEADTTPRFAGMNRTVKRLKRERERLAGSQP